MKQEPKNIMRLSAEERCLQEREMLKANDPFDKSAGWKLSPKMVEAFIMGSDQAFKTKDGKQIKIIPK